MNDLKKGKGSKSKGKAKKSDSLIKIKNQNNELHIEDDDEYKNYDNKKVKAESYSDTKIVIPAPLIYHQALLQDSLLLLRRHGSDNETL
jgi:hypothetical protein